MKVRQQGAIAFISVLVVALIAVTLMVDIGYEHQLDLRRAQRELANQKAILLAIGAEQYYSELLIQDYRNLSGSNSKQYDGLDENWSIALPFLPVEQGRLSAQLVDLQGNLNINNIILEKKWPVPSSSNGAHRLNWGKMLEDMLQGTGNFSIGESPIPSLIDWLDSNQSSLSNGAEDAFYSQGSYNYRAANSLLTDLSELSLVRGFNHQNIAPISSWVTVLPRPELGSRISANKVATKINVNTADERLLTWFLLTQKPFLSLFEQEEMLENILAKRPFRSANEFINLISSQAPLKVLLKKFIDVKSSFFLLTTIVELDGVVLEVKSWIHRKGKDVVVYRRSLRHLPQYKAPGPPDIEGEKEGILEEEPLIALR